MIKGEFNVIFIFKILSLSASFAMFIIGLAMILPHRLPKDIQNKILKCGLIHLTSKESADKIIESSAIKASKSNNCAYFFQNETIFQDFIGQNKLENKNVGIVISNLTMEQVKNLKIRYFDLSLINIGDFCFSSDNIINIDNHVNVLSSCSNMKFYLKIGLILFVVGVILTACTTVALTAV